MIQINQLNKTPLGNNEIPHFILSLSLNDIDIMEITVFNLSMSEFKPALFACSILYPEEIKYRYRYRNILGYIYLLQEKEHFPITTNGKEKGINYRAPPSTCLDTHGILLHRFQINLLTTHCVLGIILY